VALKVPAVAPEASMMLGGIAIDDDVELTVTVVFVDTGCDRVTVHKAVPPDITPVGLQATAVTTRGAFKEIVTDCEEPL